MNSLKVFVILFGIVVARGEPAASNKANQLDAKNVQQVTKPVGLEAASTRTQHLQMAHSQYQANHMGNAHNQDIKLSHHSTVQNSQFLNQEQDAKQLHSQNQALQFHSQEIDPQFHSQELNDQFSNQGQAQPFHNQDLNERLSSQDQNQEIHRQSQVQQYHDQNQAQQFHSQEQAQQFHNQAQAQQFHNQAQAQQFHNQAQAQQFHNQVAGIVRQNQDFSNLQQSQQQMTPTAVSMLHSQTKEQIRDFTQQQLFSSGMHPQQGFFQSSKDQHSVAKGLVDPSNQQGGLFTGLLRSTEVVKSSGLPRVYGQVSAFEKGLRPIVLPGVTSHSSSVVVSGLKNLPSLPALVYSAGAVPSTQVVAYGRPWHQGGAYVRQQWQSPYARYVYSHIL